MRLTLAHSPDSDDMAMWWPLTGMLDPNGVPVEGEDGRPALDTGGIEFVCRAADVETLNREAIRGEGADITAISCAAYPAMADRFRITACGASIGDGYGPKVVTRTDAPFTTLESLAGRRIGTPGVHTTAWMTFSIGAGEAMPVELPFETIPERVAQDESLDAGILIHEAQVQDTGLREVVDLGAWWKARHGLLPLGLNVVSRSLDERHGAGTVDRVAALLGASVAHARREIHASKRFLRLHATGRPEWHDEALLDRYLGMYVNRLTEQMGDDGVRAIRTWFEVAGFGTPENPVPPLDIAGLEVAGLEDA